MLSPRTKETALKRSRRPGRSGRLSGILVGLAVLVPAPATPAAPVYGYDVVEVYPHDREAFTQGLIVRNGVFYESTGLFGESSLRKVEIETGEVLLRRDLDPEYFGEGLTALRDTLYQITWTNQEAFTWVERDTFELVEASFYPWEGWGLTEDGRDLIATDGSDAIRFLDPVTREVRREIAARDDGFPIDNLNELEYIQGRIYANVLPTSRIVVLDPTSGEALAWLDLEGLRDSVSYDPGANILNGIAFEAETGRLFVTGKRWPKLFEIAVPTLDPSGLSSEPRAGRHGPSLRLAPNPTDGSTGARFVLSETAEVSLRLFGPRGRLLRARNEACLAPGAHEVRFDLDPLPTGRYWIQIETPAGISSRPLILVR